MELASRVMHTTSWALNIANRRLLAQLLLLLFSSSLSFFALFTKFALGRATASRIREVFRQTGEDPVSFLLAAQTVSYCGFCCHILTCKPQAPPVSLPSARHSPTIVTDILKHSAVPSSSNYTGASFSGLGSVHAS